MALRSAASEAPSSIDCAAPCAIILPRVSVPTLVPRRRNDRAVRVAAGRDMASRITGAQFVELDGNDHWFFAGAQQPVLEAIRRFVNAQPRHRRPTR
jgi:pimeloyl-ACP methyl ester carboxylesterase